MSLTKLALMLLPGALLFNVPTLSLTLALTLNPTLTRTLTLSLTVTLTL